MAATGAEMRTIFQDIFGTDGQHLTDISEWLRLAQRGERSTIKVDYSLGAENEDPVEWLTAFKRAAITNRWTDEARKKALARGHLRGAAADWFDSVTTAMGDH